MHASTGALRRLGSSLLALATAALAVGCSAGADPDESQVAADGSQAMMASSQSQYAASVVFEGVSVDEPLKAAAELAATRGPLACVTRTNDATDSDVVHLTFHDCTGPFGLVHLDGEEVVTFSAGAASAVHAEILGLDLTANGVPIDHSATADITFPSTKQRNVVWQNSWTRVNEAGDKVVHISDLEIAVDLATGCRTSNGTALTHVASRTVDTTLTDYEMCRNPTTGLEGCPSGTVVDTARPQGKTVKVHYDGSAVSDVTGPHGDTFDVPLLCLPNGR